jgi:hypothetical protein
VTITTNQRCCSQIWVVAEVATEVAAEVATEVLAEVLAEVLIKLASGTELKARVKI